MTPEEIIEVKGSIKGKDPNHGDNIRKARNFRGLTQESFAKLIGKSKSTVSGWENKNELPEEVLTLAAKVLGIEMAVLRDCDLAEAPLTYANNIGSITTQGANTSIGNQKVEINHHDPYSKTIIENYQKLLDQSLKERSTLMDGFQKVTEQFTAFLDKISEKE